MLTGKLIMSFDAKHGVKNPTDQTCEHSYNLSLKPYIYMKIRDKYINIMQKMNFIQSGYIRK